MNEPRDVAVSGAAGAQDGERRNLLAKFASATFAGLVAPAIASAQERPAATAAPTAGSGLYTEIDAADPIGRMTRELLLALKKPVAARRWIMVIDLRKCTDCQGCTVACIQENKLPPGVVYRPVRADVQGQYPNVTKRFLPRPCMQCDDPPCVAVCPTGASWKRPDGIVAIDYEKCIGCKYCIQSCPYEARVVDYGRSWGETTTGQLEQFEKVPSFEYGEIWPRAEGSSPIGAVRKCTFCAHRIEQGLLPACTLSCMGRATFFGDKNDPHSLVSELITKPNVMRLRPDLGTDPQVYYLT
jgi:molybdopterin-containing oxidoreductase family iron-sulfur binding subunit